MGHIHIGYDNNNYYNNMLLVKYLDLFVSLPLLLMEPDSDRKQLYGKAGAFRNTKFGVEYRVTSNFVYSSEEMIRWLYKSIINAIDYYNNDSNNNVFNNYTYNVLSAINNKEITNAKKILKIFNIKVPNLKNKNICVD